jgi:hypothetical protein
MTLKSRIDAIVRDGLAPSLKAGGFRKRGRTFRAQHDDHPRIVAIVGGTHNTNLDFGSVGSFAVELGIFFPDVFAIDGVELGRDPGINECYVRAGLGTAGSCWGHFDDLAGTCPSDADQTCALTSDWDLNGHTWLKRYSDRRAAYEFVRNNNQWREALYFAIALNDTSAASECLRQCNRVWGGMLIEHINAIATRHGVS